MLLEVKNLRVRFDTASGPADAVDGITFSIGKGKTHILVGESGCGKSVSALAISGLLPASAEIIDGSIRLSGDELVGLDPESMRSVRGGRIGMIFQEPMTSLNPVMRVGDQILEAIRTHPERALREGGDPVSHAIDLIASTGIREAQNVYRKYPHELSGGMRQRIMIAMALSCGPELLIADEPTTALDVTTQAQILGLMADLQKRFGSSILFITHNLGVAAQIGHTISIMYAGQIVEEGSVRDVFEEPCHPYTKALFAALPAIHGPRTRLKPIPGTVPPATEYPRLQSPCRFFERCEFKDERCFQKSGRPGHISQCGREGMGVK
jgi:peptide/nickel transport system ATP-binding protein